MLNTKKILRQAATPLLFSAGMLTWIVLQRPSIMLIAAVVLTYHLATKLYHTKEYTRANANALIKSSGYILIFIGVIYLLSKALSGWGWVGIIIIVLLIAAHILVRGWRNYIETIRDIERQIWGSTAEERRREKR